jgi:general secretion pathway protein K
MKSFNKKSNQSGVALITVLMIVAIMVTIAATMTGRLSQSLKRTEGITFAQKVYWYGQAAAGLGKMILEDDFSDSSIVSLDQVWATQGMIFPLEEGSIAGEMKDLRSCFNVNAVGLADKDNVRAVPVQQLQTLLEALDISSYDAETIAESTRDWVDSDDQSNASQGAEDSFYAARVVPHLAANSLMVDISELRSVQGVSADIYDKVSPYLCAIPSKEQKINVNTVSFEQAEILFALFKNEFPVTVSELQEWLEDRPTSGWASVDEFLNVSLFDDLEASSPIKQQLSVESEFFQLNGIAEFSDRLLAVDLVFQINAKKAKLIRYQSGGFK